MNRFSTKFNYFFLILTCLYFTVGYGQDTYKRNESVDIQSYIFSLELSDATNEIKGEALISLDFKNEETFILDLVGKIKDYGMTVTKVTEAGRIVDYTFIDNKVKINAPHSETKKRTFKINYNGIPERGLVIDTTKFGQRSFFGDNWPNLARHWLPSVDHPYDKASIEFRITAPSHYDVVATGGKNRGK